MKTINRRSFCKSMAIAGTGAMMPRFSIANPSISANSKVNIGWIGVGGIGQYGLKDSLGENIVALCDVDWRENPGGRAGRAAAEHAALVPHAPKFTDFRKMIDRMDSKIDAVSICTPDHTHYPMAMEAIKRGKHVFVQKPLAHNILQVRTLQKAAA